MNKFIKSTAFLVFVAFGSVLFSCKGTGNKENGQAANDSVQVADTLSADNVAQNVEQKRRRKTLLLVARVIWLPLTCMEM